jgi:hypothetical protein
MTHHTTADFWECYARLPEAVQRLADGNYELLRANPHHPSLHFKRVGRLVVGASWDRLSSVGGGGWGRPCLVLDRVSR